MSLVFIITSVIYFKDKGLSYTKTRSVYSPRQRFNQTIGTINSIRKFYPEAKIILIEMGLEDIKDWLSELVDNYIYLGNSKTIRFFVDSRYKWLGETTGILKVLFSFLTKKPDTFFIKISWRYFVTKKIEWTQNIFNFRKTENGSISTRLYWVPVKYLDTWKVLLLASLPFLMVWLSVEFILWQILRFVWEKKIKYVSELWIEWYIGPDGSQINE